MIKNELKYPLRLKQEEALLRNLPLPHIKQSDIAQNIRKLKAGFTGEKELAYHLRYLPKEQFLIFHDLRIPYEDYFFQMDTLLLSSQAAFIIEAKNIYGHLFFDSHTNQVFRTFEGKREGFPDPPPASGETENKP